MHQVDAGSSCPTSGHDPQQVLARLCALQARIGSLTEHRDELLVLASTASRRIRDLRSGTVGGETAA